MMNTFHLTEDPSKAGSGGMFDFSPFDLCLLAIMLALAVIAAKEAKRRGYYPAPWFVAGGLTGLIGLLILALLPFVNEKSSLPEPQRKSRRRIGNLIGGVVSAVGLALALVALLV
ncbi:MAG: hypothetical protein ACYC35_19630 [Pirellulales bacterium]